jgi:hypothetical protein
VRKRRFVRFNWNTKVSRANSELTPRNGILRCQPRFSHEIHRFRRNRAKRSREIRGNYTDLKTTSNIALVETIDFHYYFTNQATIAAVVVAANWRRAGQRQRCDGGRRDRNRARFWPCPGSGWRPAGRPCRWRSRSCSRRSGTGSVPAEHVQVRSMALGPVVPAAGPAPDPSRAIARRPGPGLGWRPNRAAPGS